MESETIHTNYVPVEREVAVEAIPYEVSYPSYIPFPKKETGFYITRWKKSKKNIVTSIRYPSTEGDSNWQEGSLVQSRVAHVKYSVANFDRYYSKYKESDDYKFVEVSGEITGLFKGLNEMSGAELHWFEGGKEYNLSLLYFSDNQEKVKQEIIKIAESI